MKTIYKRTENIFEKFSSTTLKIFGSPVTFLLAVITVIIYISTTSFQKQSFHQSIYDIILCFTFLGFFIIQKTFNKSNAALNLKINELLSAHDNASNRMVNIENKTETELAELSKHYSKIAEQSEEGGTIQIVKSIEHTLEQQRKDKIKKPEE